MASQITQTTDKQTDRQRKRRTSQSRKALTCAAGLNKGSYGTKIKALLDEFLCLKCIKFLSVYGSIPTLLELIMLKTKTFCLETKIKSSVFVLNTKTDISRTISGSRVVHTDARQIKLTDGRHCCDNVVTTAEDPHDNYHTATQT